MANGQGKGVRSARGTMVNFDLLKIKQQLALAPKTTEVKARENFIDAKFKRRLKKAQQVATAAVEAARQTNTQFPETVVQAPAQVDAEEPVAEGTAAETPEQK